VQSFRVDKLGDNKLRLHDPQNKMLAERELKPDAVEAFAENIRKGYRSRDPNLPAIGGQLFHWLDDPNEQWMEKIRKGGPSAAICFDVDGKLRDLPWELMCEKGAFLGINPARLFTPIRRVTDVHSEARGPANRPLRVLFMASSPVDGGSVLDFEKEEAIIIEATQRESLELIVEESGSLQGLDERLTQIGREAYDVLHLTGHATISKGLPCFIMEDDTGGDAPATAEDIAKVMKGHWPRVVFLSGCRTGETPDEGVWPSLCAALVEAGAPAVLGWARPVKDFDASVAAGALYKHMAGGTRTDESVALVRAALADEKSDQWHLLRLYANATDLSPLVTPPGAKGRKRLHVRVAQEEFLDAGARSEVCPSSLFVGRRRAIQRCLTELRSPPAEVGHHEGILLSGMGGLGKSSLGARLCDRMRRHRRVVWVGVIDETQILNVLGDKLGDPEAAAVLNEPRLSLKQRLIRLLDEHLDEKPVLFVFDDFEQNAIEEAPGRFRLDDEGRAVLKTDAKEVLRNFLEAIRETVSDSRVLVTCRYRFAPPSTTASLYEEVLDHFHGADLDKKLVQLNALTPFAATDKTLRERATSLAAGNPRLLERLDAVLQDKETDSDVILATLEATAEEFREETLLQALLDQQAEECRALLALISVCELPIDRDAVDAIANEHPVDPHLDRAAALGLVESAVAPGLGDSYHYVSSILDPLLKGELSDDQRTAACDRAARHLFEGWWVQADHRAIERALEVHRLAMNGRVQEIAVVVGDAIATSWVNSSRFREAETFCRLTLTLGDDYRILHTLANAERPLGNTSEARDHYEQALGACSGADAESDEDSARERAAILGNLASLETQQGDIARALKLWQESLEIEDSIGNVGGKAATLHNMAGVIAQQGDIARALKLWEESLEIKESIGDVRGKAATLAQMAWAAGQQGDTPRKRQLYLGAARALSQVRAWDDLRAVLRNLGESDEPDTLQFLAQGLWLVRHIEAPLDKALGTAASLQQKLGDDSDAAPLVATFANFQVQTRGEGHPKKEELQEFSMNMLAACAAERKVPPEKFMEWVQAEGLNDPSRFIPALDAALEALVPDDAWLFDRALFTS